MTVVGEVSVEFDGDASGMKAAQAEVTKALGNTTKAFDETATASKKVAASTTVTTSAFARLRDGADTLDQRAGRLQTAISGVSSAFGVMGQRVADIVGGVADMAMSFATGGALQVGLLALGVTVVAVADHFDLFGRRAEKATAEAAKHASDLHKELVDINLEMQAMASGRPIEIARQRARVGTAEESARSAIDALGGADRYARFAGYADRGIEMSLTDSEAYEKAKAAATELNAQTKILNALIAKSQLEEHLRGEAADAAATAQAKATAEVKTSAAAAEKFATAVDLGRAHVVDMNASVSSTATALDTLAEGALDAARPGRFAFGAAESMVQQAGGNVAAQIVNGDASVAGAVSAIATALGGPVAGQMAGKVADAVASGIADLVDGVLTLIGDSRLSSAVQGTGGALGGALTAMLVGAAVGISALVVGAIVGPLALIFAPIVAMVAVIVLLPALLLSLVVAIAAAVVAVPTLMLGVAAFAFQLSTSTQSFGRFQSAMSAVVDKLVSALEPFWSGMMFLAGIALTVANALRPMMAAFAEGGPLVSVLFEVVRAGAVAFVGLAIAAAYTQNALISFAAWAADLVGNKDLAKDLRSQYVDTGPMRGAFNDLIKLSADAFTEIGEGLVKDEPPPPTAAGASSTLGNANIPSGYKLANAMYAASDGQGPGGVERNQRLDLFLTVDNGLMRQNRRLQLEQRGSRMAWVRSGAGDDDVG